MKLFTRLMLVLAILLSTTSAAFAREVKGNVVDTADEPLIGEIGRASCRERVSWYV